MDNNPQRHQYGPFSSRRWLPYPIALLYLCGSDLANVIEFYEDLHGLICWFCSRIGKTNLCFLSKIVAYFVTGFVGGSWRSWFWVQNAAAGKVRATGVDEEGKTGLGRAGWREFVPRAKALQGACASEVRSETQFGDFFFRRHTRSTGYLTHRLLCVCYVGTQLVGSSYELPCFLLQR